MELIPGLPDDIALQCLIRVPYQDFTSISCVCRRWKALLHLPHFSNQRKLSGLSQRVIAMPRRFHRYQDLNKNLDKSNIRLTLFEPQGGNWTELSGPPSMHDYPSGLPEYCEITSVGYDVVVLGGSYPGLSWKASSLVLIYNFLSGTWRRGSKMPGRPRYSFACASDNKRSVFVAGGQYDRSALIYDVVNDEWTPLPDMAHMGHECKGFFQQGKFHVIGRRRTQGQEQCRFTQVFDVENWRWDEVQEYVIEADACLKLCVIGANGKMYQYHSGKILFFGEGEGVGEFQVIAAVPKELTIFTYMIEYWDGNLMVMGAQKLGDPSEAYVLDLKSGLWTNVEIEYSGYIHTHCCLDI